MTTSASSSPQPENLKYGLSEEYWGRLSEADRQLYRNIRPMRQAAYTVQNRISGIERTLEDLDRDAKTMGGELELDPDFQRGHVWSQEKQIAFIEAILRGTAPLVIRFNSPGWTGHRNPGSVQGLNPGSIQCVDGLQRLTAMREFVAGKFPVFGQYHMADLEGTAFALSRLNKTWTMEVYDIPTRAELLQFYLDLNTGGVVHSPEEIERVQGLLEKERTAKPAKRSTKAPSP